MLLNPAFAGTDYDGRITAQSRYQWPSLRSQYRSFLVSYDQFVRKYNSGIGGYLIYDNAGEGVLQTLSASLTYSYRVQISREWEAKLGAEVGYIQSQLDWNKLIFGDQLSPVTGNVIRPSNENEPEDLRQNAIDVGMGLLVYNKDFYIGFSAKHMNTANINHLVISDDSEEALPTRFTLNAGYKMDIGQGIPFFKDAYLSPNVLIVNQADFYQVTAGAQVGLEYIQGGLWYRHAWNNADAVILSFGVDQKRWQLNYSYDLTVSDVVVSTGGSHELSFFFLLDTDRYNKYDDCFAIFR